MNSVEEKLRGVTKRGSRHGQRGTGPAGSDWSTGPRSSSGVRVPAPTAPSSTAQTSGAAYNRPQEPMGPSRRQSSRDSVDSTGQQAPPEHGELLFKVLPSLLIPTLSRRTWITE